MSIVARSMIKPRASTCRQAVFVHHCTGINALGAQYVCVTKQKSLISVSPSLAPSKKQASSHVCCAADPSTSSSNNINSECPRLQVEIPTSEAQTAIKFSAVRVGSGKAIVVEAVAIGSEAEEAGIKPGQQLFSLSDPIRPQETWTLNDRASIRYIRDAVRMRRAPFIMLEVSLAPLTEWQDEKQGGGLNFYTSESDNDAPEEEQDLLSAVAAEAAANSSPLSSLDSTDLAPGTIGERLQRNYNKSNTGMTDLERRVEKRKEYFEQTSTRNDGPFFAAVLAAFLLPAFIILGIASSSGYLDALASGWAGR